jgi:hypothetical protein
MQMKQSQPADAGGGSPVLALHVADGRWRLLNTAGDDTTTVWSARAKARRWTRFAFDVTYSTDPSVGSMRIYVDLDGDGDARSGRERSPLLHLQTLKPEGLGGTDDGLALGDAIPSHLRVGLYHDDEYDCELQKCAVDVDNVAVYRP